MPESANKLAITQLLHLLFSTSQNAINVHSYWEDFNELWSNKEGQDRLIVIVWENRPLGDRNLSPYLSPIDWAVWKTLSGAQNKQSCRIVIFDIASYSEANPPGVGLYKLLEKNQAVFGGQIELVRLKPDDSSWGIQRLVSLASGAKDESETSWCNVNLVKQLWRSIFLNPESPEDNHSLSNALGPSLISKEVSNDPSIAAIKDLLVQLELMPDTVQFEIPWFDWSKSKWKRRIKRIQNSGDSPLRILMVDDKAAKFGWLKIVATKLGLQFREDAAFESCHPELVAKGLLNNLPCELYFTSNADSFIDSIVSIKRFQYRTKVDCAIKQNSGTVGIDMLLLDMRLFEGHEKTEELGFFKKLESKVATSIDNKNDSMWPANLHQEVEKISNWLHGNAQFRHDKMFLNATLLLSKWIATQDGSLPIIFFSSTDRKVVADEMRKYGSVILDFKKPKIQIGTATELYSATRSGFVKAFAKGLDLVMARRIGQALSRSDYSDEVAKHQAKLPSRKIGAWNVLIAVDETGDIFKGTRMTVGGLMGIFPPGEFPAEFEKWIHEKFPELAQYSKQDWRRSFERIFKEILRESRSRQVLWLPISLGGSKPNNKIDQDLDANSSWQGKIGDNFHRTLIKQLMEYSIFCVARLLLSGKTRSCSLSVLLPTRSIPLQLIADHSNTHPRQLEEDLFDKLGVHCGYAESEAKAICQLEDVANTLNKSQFTDSTKTEFRDFVIRIKTQCKGNHEKRAFFLEPKDALPMAQEVIAHYPHSTFGVQPETIRAFRINRFGQQDEASLNYAIHYLADKWVGVESPEELTTRSSRLFISTAIKSDSGGLFDVLLRVNRYLANGLVTQAILEFQAVLPVSKEQLNKYWPIFCLIRSALAKLRGTDFVAFARLLAESNESDL